MIKIFLNQNRKELFGKCFLLFGDIEKKSGKLSNAIKSYKESLRLHDTYIVRKRLADVFVEKGNILLKSKKFAPARVEFEKGLVYIPDDSSLIAKKDEALSQYKHKNLVKNITGLVLFIIIGLCAAFWYYGQSAFEITSTPTSAITLRKGSQTIVSDDNGKLQTSLLRYGSYSIVIEKEGYEPINQKVSAGLGRKTKKIEVALKPVYGTLKVNSDPPGAKVEIDGEVTGDTPFESNQCLAKEVKVVIRHTDKGRYASSVKIEPGKTTDLGTVQLYPTGFTLDSFPTGLNIYDGDKLLGKTPVKLKTLDPGPINLTIKENGWIWNKSVTVKENEVLSLSGCFVCF